MDGKRRCKWCNERNESYVRYHDEEWGVQNFSDAYLYEMLLLECFQAGLSWECVLNKREAFRAAFDGFAPERVAAYGEEKIAELMENKGIIRCRRKIEASVKNSRIFLDIVKEYGSFYNYIKGFTGGAVTVECGQTTNALSDAIAKDLTRRKMKYTGSVTVYSYLQAIGVIQSHEEGCFLYQAPMKK